MVYMVKLRKVAMSCLCQCVNVAIMIRVIISSNISFSGMFIVQPLVESKQVTLIVMIASIIISSNIHHNHHHLHLPCLPCCAPPP